MLVKGATEMKTRVPNAVDLYEINKAMINIFKIVEN